jgi:hypothetical protein
MEKPMARVGFIFECGRDGPDFKVCSHLLSRLNPNIEMVARFLDNTEGLLTDCGPVARALLTEERCARVVVAWDLEPAWEKAKPPCRHDDKERAFQSLRGARVPPSRVLLLCIERELECWLMADNRALQAVIARYKHPHPVGRLPDFRRPDHQIGRPKTELIRLFQRELGRTRKYVDRDHALLLAKAIPDWSRLRRSDSFRRFAEKAARVTLP